MLKSLTGVIDDKPDVSADGLKQLKTLIVTVKTTRLEAKLCQVMLKASLDKRAKADKAIGYINEFAKDAKTNPVLQEGLAKLIDDVKSASGGK